MTCFLFRLLSCDQENGQYKRGKFIRQSRFPSLIPSLASLAPSRQFDEKICGGKTKKI
jgi:hypothetical protein